MLLAARGHDRGRALRPQRVEHRGERALAVQVQQVLGQELPVRPGGGAQAGHHMVVDDPVQGPVPLRRAALELGVQHVPGEIVGPEPMRPAGHERPLLQPRPHRGRVGAHHLPEELLGGQPGDGAGDQPGHVGVGRRASEQRLQQGRDEVGDLGQAVGDGAGDGGVGQQGHGQRVAPAQPDQLGTGGPGDPGPGEQLVALDLVEVVEPVDGDHRAPARIGAPERGWGVAAGQDDQAVSRQRGQERPP